MPRALAWGSAGWCWFVNNHLGTPQKMVDAAGDVVWAAAYAPFGEARVYQDEITNNLRFPGQYYDVETGLQYNWHRYYDPGTGRYLTPDPIGLAGGLNLYAYVLNNPTNSIDPFGLTATVIPGVMPLPFPGAHPVFQPGTPENQAIGNDLSSIFRLMDPSPLVRDVIRMITGPKDEECESDGEKRSKLKAKDRRSLEKKRSKEQKHGDGDWEEPAPEDYAKWKGKMLEKRSGKDARRKAHDEPHLRDRTKNDLDRDYEQ